ncbi:hypothetical protein [Micromonospora sicca]|uniref:hypothetical protein n=1 Tax=Micromonospora sicca TaxID=2202420 RepID=UPI00191C04B4|nr:hypothetical protein [Micromonospora sp. 4G51]
MSSTAVPSPKAWPRLRAGDFKNAVTLAERFTAGARHLHHSVMRDALAAGLDWWQIGELLTLHPQAAFDAYANLADGTRTPAQQHPHLAVVCTAGLAAEHDMDTEHGIDLDDLDPQHSLTTDPTVVRLRAPAQLLGDDVWIAVKLPGTYEGDDDLDDDAAIRRWTTWRSTPTNWAGCARPWPSMPRSRTTTKTTTWSRCSDHLGAGRTERLPVAAAIDDHPSSWPTAPQICSPSRHVYAG